MLPFRGMVRLNDFTFLVSMAGDNSNRMSPSLYSHMTAENRTAIMNNLVNTFIGSNDCLDIINYDIAIIYIS